jgi:hypothetical protein
MADPREVHLKFAKRVLRYLAGTMDVRLLYSREGSKKEHELEVYSDSDWGDDPHTRKSVSGMLSMLDGNLIAWKSNKQSLVTISSMEAEYVALVGAAQELIYLQRLFQEITDGIGMKDLQLNTVLYCDNDAAASLVKNASLHKRSKHIDIKFHWIREKYGAKCFELRRVSSAGNIADLFTKSLSAVKFRDVIALMKNFKV